MKKNYLSNHIIPLCTFRFRSNHIL